MKLRYDAIHYVATHGDPYQKLYLAHALGEAASSSVVEEIISLQNPDGGWPWQSQKGKPSGVGTTARVLELLLKTGLQNQSEVCSKALSFLLSLQREDGGWSENPELSGLIPKDWIWVSTAHSMTHITGDVINALLEAGYVNAPNVAKAIAFLKDTQNQEGGWPSHLGPGYTYGTDVAGMDVIVRALLKAGEPPESELFKKAVIAMVNNRKDWGEPVCNASILNVFMKLGFNTEHEYVQELVKTLVEKQRPDGGWNWHGDLPSNLEQTVYCIKQLKKCGVEF